MFWHDSRNQHNVKFQIILFFVEIYFFFTYLISSGKRVIPLGEMTKTNKSIIESSITLFMIMMSKSQILLNIYFIYFLVDRNLRVLLVNLFVYTIIFSRIYNGNHKYNSTNVTIKSFKV